MIKRLPKLTLPVSQLTTEFLTHSFRQIRKLEYSTRQLAQSSQLVNVIVCGGQGGRENKKVWGEAGSRKEFLY